MKFRPTFWPTVFTVPAVLLMLGLSIWQVQRLYWKEGLIAERTSRIGASADGAPRPRIPLVPPISPVSNTAMSRLKASSPTTRKSSSAPAPSRAVRAIT